MNILEEIALSRGCHTCIALTFNFDIVWFETLVYQRLISAGVRRILVVTDTLDFSKTIERQASSINRAGIDYSIITIKVPGCFHSKAVFLSGQNIARLYIGSGNITSGGFGRNLEVFERFEVKKGDYEISPVFEQFRLYIEKLFTNHFVAVPSSVETLLTNAFGVEILTLPYSDGSQFQLIGSPNNLFQRLYVPDQPANSLVMLAPYFDSKGKMVIKIAKNFKAKEFKVITDKRRTNLCKKAADAITSSGGTIQFLEESTSRPLHAKILFAKGPSWSFGLSGSANFTIPAWHGQNAELISVRREESAYALEALLNKLAVRDSTESELYELGHFRLSEDEIDKDILCFANSVLSARWTGSNQIELNVAGPISLDTIAVEFLGPNEIGPAEEIIKSAKDSQLLVTPYSRIKRGHPALARLCSDNISGPWFVIEDPRKLAEHAKSGRRLDEFAKDLLYGNDQENPPEKLLKFLSKIYQNRRDRLKRGIDTDFDDDKEETDKQPKHIEWAWIKEEQFSVFDTLKMEEISHYESTGGRLRLINFLLFGSETPVNTNDTEGESELDENLVNTPRAFRARMPKESNFPKKRKHSGFAEVVSKVRKLYIEQLQSDDNEGYPLGRIVEDMQVLCAAIHSAFESGYISGICFRMEIQSVLLAFLGKRNAPFVQALSQVPIEKRLEEWEETPLLLFIGLILYNLCLSYSDGKKIQGSEAILWFRHLLPLAPPIHVTKVINDLDRQTPMLKNGVFWLQDALSSQIEFNPFQYFFNDLVKSTYTILNFENALPKIRPVLLNLNEINKDDRVVYQSPEGHLKVGFAEETDHPQGHLQVWLRENPFDTPLPSSNNTRISRPRSAINSVFLFRDLLSNIDRTKIENADEAISILIQLADS